MNGWEYKLRVVLKDDHDGTEHKIKGARWQREQLRKPETAEWVAKILHDRMYDALTEHYPSGNPVTLSVMEESRMRRVANARRLAQDIITELVGGEND